MDKFIKWVVIIALICILAIVFITAVITNAEKNCEEYKTICCRTEAVFGGTRNIKTRCVNDWDFQREQCVDLGFFWEDLK